MSATGSIVVVGEALVDDFGDRAVVGGAPFNVARSLAALGLPVLMVTRIADDPAGALVQQSFDRYQLGRAGLQLDPRYPTGKVIVERRGADHVFRILDRQAWDHIDARQALDAIDGVNVAALYCGTLAQREADSRAAVQALLQALKAPHYVDLNLRDGQYAVDLVAATLRQADTVKVNEAELRDLLEWFVQPLVRAEPWGRSALNDAIEQLIAQFDLSQLIVTRGEHGAACFTAPDRCLTEGAGPAPQQWGDTVGAGDAFSSVFLAGSVLGWPLATTLQRANAFAAAICGIVGAIPDDPGFYSPWRRAWNLA